MTIEIMQTRGKNEVSLTTLGEFLTRVFDERGITNITQFAESIDRSRSQISRMLDGKQGGSIDAFVDVARALDIRPGLLLDIYADEPPDPDYDPEVMRLAKKFSQLPSGYRLHIEGLIDAFLLASKQYEDAKSASKKAMDSQEENKT